MENPIAPFTLQVTASEARRITDASANLDRYRPDVLPAKFQPDLFGLRKRAEDQYIETLRAIVGEENVARMSGYTTEINIRFDVDAIPEDQRLTQVAVTPPRIPMNIRKIFGLPPEDLEMKFVKHDTHRYTKRQLEKYMTPDETARLAAEVAATEQMQHLLAEQPPALTEDDDAILDSVWEIEKRRTDGND